MNSEKKRITPALLISILALFVAIGGTSYAAVKINGKDIKKGTVAGKALKRNTLTGKQINENKLGKVPRAKTADSAANATSATSAVNAENAVSAETAKDAATVGGKTAAELASPAAFAYIDASGAQPVVPANRAHGITTANVTKENSFVCISGLGFQPRNVQATTYRVSGSTTNDFPNVSLDDIAFCDGTEQVAVQMVDGETGNPVANGRFYISLFR